MRAVTTVAHSLAGTPSLDDFLLRRISQYEKRDYARAYVAVQPDSPAVLGYYTLSTSLLSVDSIPGDEGKRLPPFPAPVVLLGRLAVTESFQGQGLDKDLLLDAMARSQRLADEIAVFAIEVDAIDSQARAFYVKYGFASLTDNSLHLYITMKEIRKLGL